MGKNVLFYTAQMREQFPNDDILFQQNSKLGSVVAVNDDTVTISYLSHYGGVALTEDIPKEYVRAAREVHWYQFWKRKGFNTNLWGYGGTILFFLLFIK